MKTNFNDSKETGRGSITSQIYYMGHVFCVCIYIYIYIHNTYTQTYIYMYIYVCVFVFVKEKDRQTDDGEIIF